MPKIKELSVFLPRQTIVNIANQKDPKAAMDELFAKYAKAGINKVHFESNPHGYAMYESSLLEKYPFLKDKDYKKKEMPDWNGDEKGLGSPLETAIYAAKKNQVSISAWTWVAKLYNKALNKVIGKPQSYTGPIKENHPELKTYSNPSLSNEVFADLADKPTKEFLLNIVDEVAKNKVDEVNLDYIRYNFGSTNTNSGAVTNFVKDVKSRLKTNNPDAKLGVTVFPFVNQTIGQKWETWPVDKVYLMNYKNNPEEFRAQNQIAQRRLNSNGRSSADQPEIIPALSVESYKNTTPEEMNVLLRQQINKGAGIFSSNGLQRIGFLEKIKSIQKSD